MTLQEKLQGVTPTTPPMIKTVNSPSQDLTKVEQHCQLCDEIHELYAKKNHDYGDSFGKTFEELGIISAATRISDKFNRFIQLAKGIEPMVNDEKIRDTLIDMANYCLMTVMELDNSNG